VNGSVVSISETAPRTAASGANERAGAWCGAVALVFLFAGLLLARFLPPPSPHADAAQISAKFLAHTTAIRAGVMIAAVAAALLVPWYAAVTVAVRRLEGDRRVLTYALLIAAGGGMMDFVLPLLFMEAAAFRPHDALFAQHLNDLGWICFIAGAPIFGVQAAAVGAAVLQSRAPTPQLPRSCGYLSLWCALLFLPGVFVVFFKTGPLAWNGVIGFWCPAVAFGVWILALAVLVIRASGPATPSTG
jgi:hypothetical protein